MTTALLDGDILVYRCGWASDKDPLGIAMARLHTMVGKIVEDTQSDADFKVYLTPTDHSNFRFEIFPEYKANRPDKKPTWYDELREILMSDYGAELAFGMEADDLLGMNQNDDTVICSIDKDLDQIPGQHYDFVKEVAYTVTKENAMRFFYFQLLTGDRTDNISGIPKVGPAKATKLLEGLTKESEYQRACLKAYEAYYKAEAFDRMLMFGRVLHIKRAGQVNLWFPNYLEEPLTT